MFIDNLRYYYSEPIQTNGNRHDESLMTKDICFITFLPLSKSDYYPYREKTRAVLKSKSKKKAI